jgi:hypothetical protein
LGASVCFVLATLFNAGSDPKSANWKKSPWL